MSSGTGRVVTLIDMDCFYCQVEARLNPVHKGKPLAVVQYNPWKGGGIIAVNYEARDKGVTRSMRGDQAKQVCPDIVLVSVASVRGKADLSKYRDAGKEVVDVFKEFCNCVERASIDEAYLDLTQAVEKRVEQLKTSGSLITASQLRSTFVAGFCPDKSNAEETRVSGLSEFLEDQKFNSETFRLAVAAALVEELRAEVLKRTGFQCSAGIAHNKVLAKLVCSIHKPQHQTVLPASYVEQLFSALPVRKVRNLGGKFGVKVVEELGCETMGDLAKHTKEELQQRFDEKTGSWLYDIARGIDCDPVTPRLIPKSIGCSKNFPGKISLSKKEDVEHWMKELCDEVAERLSQDLQENKRRAQLLTVTISLDGQSTSRSSALTSYDGAKITAEALSLISRSNNAPANSSAWQPAIFMIAVSASKFVSDEGRRSTGIESFFKQISKTSKDGTENETVIEKTVTAKDAEKTVITGKDAKNSTSSTSSVKPGKVDSFFKSQPPKMRTEIKVTAESQDERSPAENSFFLNYLHTLKPPANAEKNEPIKSTGSLDSSNRSDTSKSDDSISLIKEMFPNPVDIEESVLSFLSSSLQETFYIWRAQFRRETGLQSPEKVQLNSRKNGFPKGPPEFPSPKKLENLKPKGSIDTFFQKHGKLRQEVNWNSSEPKPSTLEEQPKGSLGTFSEKNGKLRQEMNSNSSEPKPSTSEEQPKGSLGAFSAKNGMLQLERNSDSFEPQPCTSGKQPGCSYQYVSDDSNSCDLFSLAEKSCDEMEQCSICHEMVLLREFPEHVDYHAAVSLDERLNKVEQVVKPPAQPALNATVPVIPVKKRGRPPKHESMKLQNGKKLKSISSFFTVQGSN